MVYRGFKGLLSYAKRAISRHTRQLAPARSEGDSQPMPPLPRVALIKAQASTAACKGLRDSKPDPPSPAAKKKEAGKIAVKATPSSSHASLPSSRSGSTAVLAVRSHIKRPATTGNSKKDSHDAQTEALILLDTIEAFECHPEDTLVPSEESDLSQVENQVEDIVIQKADPNPKRDEMEEKSIVWPAIPTSPSDEEEKAPGQDCDEGRREDSSLEMPGHGK